MQLKPTSVRGKGFEVNNLNYGNTYFPFKLDITELI
jgi:hypothetical protein